MANKQVIFVQGGRKNEDVYPWMFFHFAPNTDADPGTVDLVYFDYPAGKRKTWKNWDKKRGKAPTAKPDTEVELEPKTRLRQHNGTLHPGPERASVLALYDYVKEQPKESVKSLQVFSHGVISGPIIWNTWEFGPDGKSIATQLNADRDPHDTDFRIRDFHANNPLAGAELTKFKQAFTSDAFIKLWGCQAPEGVRAHILSHRDAPQGSKGDAVRKTALKLYLGLIEVSYPMQLAHELELPVWASPMGYGSNAGTVIPTKYDKQGNITRSFTVKYNKGKFPPDLKKDQWWRVSWFFRNQDRGDLLYTDVLKAKVDATDYVEHNKSWFDDALKNATASLEPGLVPSPMDLQNRLTDRIAELA